MDRQVETIPVQVSVVPGNTKAVSVDRDATVSDAIAAAGFNADGYQVRADGRTLTNPDQEGVTAGQSIILTRQVKGN